MLHSATHLLVGLLVATKVSADLDKPLIQPPFNGLGDVLQANLKTPVYTFTKWPWGRKFHSPPTYFLL